MQKIRRRRNLRANVRYFWTLLKRFKITFALLAFVQFGGSLAIWADSRDEARPISFVKAMGEIYFLMMGEPTFELPDTAGMMLLTVLVPPLGLAIIADGLVRFAYLFFAKHKNDQEWITVLADSMKDHVVLCGAGRVGYRILEQLERLKIDVLVIEKNESSPFVHTIRDLKIPILIDDVRSDTVLQATNITAARAIICATDDDLANLNIALDARRMNPDIHVVMRFFDEDLVAKVKSAFNVEALSTSALAAPSFAASAIDPRIVHSFEVAGQLMVVAQLPVEGALAGKTVDEVRVKHNAFVLRIGSGDVFRNAAGTDVLNAGESMVLQATLEDYRRLLGHDPDSLAA